MKNYQVFRLDTNPHIQQNTDLLVKWCYQIQGGQFYIHYT